MSETVDPGNPKNSAAVKELEQLFDGERDALNEEFFTFLRFESVSTDPKYQQHITDCAQWVEKLLTDAGFTTENIQTVGHPTVYAHWLGAGEDKPTILFYGHYDVQPVDPIELWETPPFEPTLRDGEVYARGAADNKGQIFYVMAALRALLKKHGALPVNVKLLIEGEEECNGVGLSKVLETRGTDFKADYVAIADVGIHDLNHPSIPLSLRGIMALEVTLTGSRVDMHSGVYGGVVYNTNHALVELLAKMRDDQGRIAIPGFYDDVVEPTPEELAQVTFDFDIAGFEKAFATTANGGEKNYSPMESAWIRPTLEINGVSGGYTGDGFKTVIPAQAKAKISARIVPNQKPEKITAAVKSFVEQNLPEGIRATVKVFPAGGLPLRTSPDSRISQIGAQAMSEVFGKPCNFVLEGASVPIVPELRDATQSEALLYGLMLPSDDIHAPNEHFGLDRLKMGFCVTGRILQLLGA